MSLTGKGMYIWKALDCEGGSAQAIARRAQAAGLSHVLLKVADGPKPYNTSHAPAIVSALRAAGLSVWGWQYVYGDNPIGEAEMAVESMSQLHLDGLAINAEREYEGKFQAADAYLDSISAAGSHIPLALASFRLPEYHASFPWTEFLSRCELNMPQVFWVKGHSPAQQLEQSLDQFRNIYPVVPIIPTGAAFEEAGWRPSSADVSEFMTATQHNGLDGINFWNWDYTGSSQGSDLWQAVSAFGWSGQTASGDSIEELFSALNRADVDAILKLYEPGGVLVTATDTSYGLHQLRSYYANLLHHILPQGQFSMENRVNEDNVEHVTWNGSSVSATRKITHAQDTIGLRAGRIKYHTSLYKVS